MTRQCFSRLKLLLRPTKHAGKVTNSSMPPIRVAAHFDGRMDGEHMDGLEIRKHVAYTLPCTDI